jgi:CRP-like cAMP-binding protein
MQLNSKMERLARIPPLAVLESEALRLLAFDGEEMTLDRDAILFRQGELGDCGYALLSGTIALERKTDLPAPVWLMKAGSFIGVSPLIVETERPASATVRDRAFLIKLPQRLVLRVVEAFPNSAAALRDYVEHGLAEQARALGRIAQSIDAVMRSYKSRETRTGT